MATHGEWYWHELTTPDAEGAHGGTVPYGPFDVPGVGRIAVRRDPQGAVFSLIRPA